MRAVCSALKMGLFLHVVGSVSPTEPTEEGNLLHCEGLNNHSYVCESGHCCGESKCCNYYYELWWFWLVWAIIVILSCCCICHHRRTKHRLQQQQRQHEINLIAYREAHNYTSVPFYFRFLPNYLLPDYEEVVNRPPTPPPPYSALHTISTSLDSSPLSNEQQEGRCPAIQSTPVPPVSDTLCSRPSLEESELGSRGFRPKLDNKPLHTAQESGTITRSDTLQDGLAREGPGSLEKRDGGGDGDDSCKDPLLKDLGGSEVSAEDKERLPGSRRRRFTGDSGIEVCVCGPQGNSGCSRAGVLQEGKELRELESLLGCEEDEEGADFCDSCGHRAQFSADEEQVLGGLERQHSGELADEPQMAQQTSSASPVCLLLHTINEQEGPHSGSGTEPQG